MSDRSSVSERLRALVEKWRKRADHGFDPEEDEDSIAYWNGVKQCADELDALLSAEVPALPWLLCPHCLHRWDAKGLGVDGWEACPSCRGSFSFVKPRAIAALQSSAEVPASTGEGLRERLLEEARIWEPSPLTLLLREAAAALPSPPTSTGCVCTVDDGLVHEWVQKARAVARAKGFDLLPSPPTPAAPLTQEQDIRAHVASVIACAERDCVVNPQFAGGLQPVIALLREAVNSPVSTPPEQAGAPLSDEPSDAVMREHWRRVSGPKAELTGPLIRFAVAMFDLGRAEQAGAGAAPTPSGIVDIEQAGANMYGCLPCPKCKAVYRFPRSVGIIQCDDCGFTEPWIDPAAAQREGEQP